MKETGALVALADVKAALGLFATAVGGRERVLREQPIAPRNALIRPRGNDIGLPGAIAWFATSRDNRAAYRIEVLRQALGPAAPAGTDAEASPLWRRVHRTLELLRIDAVIARGFPGARDDLARARRHALAQRPAQLAAGAVRRPLDVLLRVALDATFAAPREWAAMCALAAALAREGASAGDSADAASLICGWLCGGSWRDRIAQRSGAEPTPLGPAAAPGDPGSSRRDDAQTSGPSAFGGTGAGGPLAHDGGRAVAARAARTLLPPRRHTRPAGMSVAAAPGIGQRHSVDEWDCHLQRYRPDWCTLFEQRQRGNDTAFIHNVRRRHAALAREVHRRFAALRPVALQRVHGVGDGDELELERVIEAVIDRRAGRIADPALYVRRERAQRDVGAVFLVDTSASTDFVLHKPAAPTPPAPPGPYEIYLHDLQTASAVAAAESPRRVIDVAKDALALMCDALQTLGDAFAVYAFSGHGRDHVDFRVVKEFDDAVSSRTAASLSALRPQGATRAGAAIRHATAKLAHQPQHHKVLIVVSDGYPEDIDYGPEPRQLRYAIEDTAHALQEAEALGIRTFNLSIDPAGHDYLRRMCPPQRYMVIGGVAALPGELSKVYLALTP